MGFGYDVYHDDNGNLQIDTICPICGSTRGFYRRREDNNFQSHELTHHSVVTYCLSCGSDVKREGTDTLSDR